MKIENRMTLDVQQGTPEWLEVRTKYFTASAAPAMMGDSPYQTRADLLSQMATGREKEVDIVTQKRFDAGHAAEAAARPLAEEQIGADLYPVTCVATVDGLPLLASLDGMTMDETCLFEHKLWNLTIAEDIERNGEPGPAYYWQMEHQLLVTGAHRCLFVASDGTDEKWVHFWYISDPERRAKLVAGWKQFAEDLKNYQHVEVLPPPTAAPISDLPALDIQISGHVLASNLVTWRDVVQMRIAGIKTDLQNDQDFADAEATCKFLGDGEKRIDVVKSQVQSQASSIDEVFRAMDDIKAMMRAKRLELEKLVSARKDAIRAEIMDDGRRALAEHMKTLSGLMPEVKADWAGVMKGKKTVASLRNAVDTELARAKIEATQIHEQIIINIATLDEYSEHATLFPDRRALVLKAPDDLLATIKARIADHQAKEEELRLIKEKREADAKARAEAMPPVTERIDHGNGIQTVVVADSTRKDDGRQINLSEICGRLGFTVTSQFLGVLGIQHAGKVKAAIMYRESDWPVICSALVRHINAACAQREAA